MRKEASIIEFFKDIHSNPEIGFEVDRTKDRVISYIKEFSNMDHIEIAEIGKNGLKVFINNGKDRVIGFRSELDALPINEETSLEYKSKISGRMHACGHDSHISILVGLIVELSRLDLDYNIVFYFEPSEESPPGGARFIVEDDKEFLKNVDFIIAFHNHPFLDYGVYGIRKGPIMAEVYEFDIDFIGSSTHAAYPHEGEDPIYAFSLFNTQLQGLISRFTSPTSSTIASIGSVKAGEVFNIIPDRLNFKGTLRTLNRENVKLLEDKFLVLLESVSKFVGINYKINVFESFYPILENSSLVYSKIKDLFDNLNIKYKEIEPSLGGETFSYFGKYTEIFYVFFGINNGKDRFYPWHSSRFFLPPDIIPKVIKDWIEILKML